MRRTLTAVSGVALCAFVIGGCKREPPVPTPETKTTAPDPAIAETAALAALPIHIDQPLGDDLQLVGVSVQAQPDRRSWVVTLHSKALRKQERRPEVWLHAYPNGSQEYLVVGMLTTTPVADAGRVVMDGFQLKKGGAFNLYAGVMRPDGSYGPAVPIGWIGVGDPDTKEYQDAYRFLQEANDARALAMLDQARRDYPNARLP